MKCDDTGKVKEVGFGSAAPDTIGEGWGVSSRSPFQKAGVATIATLIKKEEPELRNDLAVGDIRGALEAKSILSHLDSIGACRARISRVEGEKEGAKRMAKVKDEEKNEVKREKKRGGLGPLSQSRKRRRRWKSRAPFLRKRIYWYLYRVVRKR